MYTQSINALSMAILSAWQNWRDKRLLKQLGSLEPHEVNVALEYHRRRARIDNYSMGPVFCGAKFWITGGRHLPVVKGRLWERK